MEAFFGRDFSTVRIHEDGGPDSIGAKAYTRGEHIHFSPGKFQPESVSGQELLGHELAHVGQQRDGRVATPQGKGLPINADVRLEREADRMGAQAARRTESAGSVGTGHRESAHGVGCGCDACCGSSAPTQAKSEPSGKVPLQLCPTCKKSDCNATNPWQCKHRRSMLSKPPAPVYSKEDPYRVSFEASGDAQVPLEYARSLTGADIPFDMQVGVYEGEGTGIPLMKGAEENIKELKRLGVRVNTSRDARRRNSLTQYDDVIIRNLMAATTGGESDTSKEANEPLTREVIEAQAQKLRSDGQLHFGASGNPFFKPGKTGIDPSSGRAFEDKVDVDEMAQRANLTRRPSVEYEDQAEVQKNTSSKTVGVGGTATRVYSRNPRAGHRLPVPMPGEIDPSKKRERSSRFASLAPATETAQERARLMRELYEKGSRLPLWSGLV